MIELEVYLVIIGEIVRGDVICKENQAAIFVCAILYSYYSHCKITPYLLLLYYVCTLQPHLLHRIMKRVWKRMWISKFPLFVKLVRIILSKYWQLDAEKNKIVQKIVPIIFCHKMTRNVDFDCLVVLWFELGLRNIVLLWYKTEFHFISLYNLVFHNNVIQLPIVFSSEISSK